MPTIETDGKVALFRETIKQLEDISGKALEHFLNKFANSSYTTREPDIDAIRLFRASEQAIKYLGDIDASVQVYENLGAPGYTVLAKRDVYIDALRASEMALQGLDDKILTATQQSTSEVLNLGLKEYLGSHDETNGDCVVTETNDEYSTTIDQLYENLGKLIGAQGSYPFVPSEQSVEPVDVTDCLLMQRKWDSAKYNQKTEEIDILLINSDYTT